MAGRLTSTECFLLTLVGALIALCTALPLGAHRYILEKRLDGCPCKVQWGGYTRKSSQISVEIITVREYKLWVEKGRPPRYTNQGNYNDGFCGASSTQGAGVHVMLIGTNHDGVEGGIVVVDREECKPTSIFDFNKQRDHDECKATKSETAVQVPVPQEVFNSDQELGAFNVHIKHFSNDTSHRRMLGCSGSLIAPRWVMTAAHCHISEGDNVIVGMRKGETGETIAVAQTFKHPAFRQLTTADVNDIQLLRLNREVTKAKDHIIAVNKDCKRPAPFRFALVPGYGRSIEGDANNAKCADQKLCATLVEIIENKKCHDLLGSAHASEAYLDSFPYICAAHQFCRGDTCLGDSGAPLVVVDPEDDQLVQVGIASYRTGTQVQRGHPQVYVRVSAYADWIKNITGGEAKMMPSHESTQDQKCPNDKLTARESCDLLREHDRKAAATPILSDQERELAIDPSPEEPDDDDDDPPWPP